jgi:hypothetical protein
MLAYSSGADDLHLDINVMTTRGMHVRRLTDYEGGDESPDWQMIPAPRTKRCCGDLTGAAGTVAARPAATGSSRSCTSRDGAAGAVIRYAAGGGA